MPKEVLVAIVAGAAAILGGVLTALASAYSTSHKIKELQIKYLQEKRDTYLANARAHVGAIYIPLQASITRLILRFEEYRRSAPADIDGIKEREAAFREEAGRFISATNTLLHSGADAFLTTELSEALRSFLSFLRSSLDANEAREKLLVSYGMNLGGVRVANSHDGVFRSAGLERFFISSFSLDVLGIGFTATRTEVVEAPLESDEYEKRFVKDSILLRGLIKEVTLGSRALPR
jgi:hypothetical protein